MKSVLFVFCCYILISCKNYYNDTLHWIDALQPGVNIQKVKSSQPSFVIIDWEHPQAYNDTTKIYSVTEIDGSHDVLKMSHRLVFHSDKFIMRESHK